MSVRSKADPKDIRRARYMKQIGQSLHEQFLQCKATDPALTVAKLARKLDVDKSVLWRQLNGGANLTAATIADIVWALNGRPKLVIERVVPLPEHTNGPPHKVGAPASTVISHTSEVWNRGGALVISSPQTGSKQFRYEPA